MSIDVDILVVGAGPTGLAAANEAVRHGLSVRIDRKAHRSTYSKALVVHARTLEAFEAMGVAEAVRAAGVPYRYPTASGLSFCRPRSQLDLTVCPQARHGRAVSAGTGIYRR